MIEKYCSIDDLLERNFIRFVFIFFLGLFSYQASATEDILPPNYDDGVCDELIGETPGLYELCSFYCKVQSKLDSHNAPSGTFAGLIAKILSSLADRALDKYDSIKQAGDPDMPCIEEEVCPCWSPAELEETFSRFPPGDDFRCVWYDGPEVNGSDVSDSGYDFVALDNQSTPGEYGDNAACTVFIDGLEGAPPTTRSIEITPDQLRLCDAQLRQASEEVGASECRVISQ